MTKGVRLSQTIPVTVYETLIESAKHRGLTPAQLLTHLIISYAPPVNKFQKPPTEVANELLKDLDFGE